MKTKAIFKNAQKALDEERIKEQELKNIIGFCFSSNKDIEDFVRASLKKDSTRWMLNRLQWFVELADFQKYDSVKTFFLIAMAETNIKLLEKRLNENGNETADVKKFFAKFSSEDKKKMREQFFKTDRFLKKHYFRFTTVVEALLNVRHRLAHGKSHYEFRFHSGKEDLLNLVWGEVGSKKSKRKIMYELALTYDEFRKLMIANAIQNIEKCMFYTPK